MKYSVLEIKKQILTKFSESLRILFADIYSNIGLGSILCTNDSLSAPKLSPYTVVDLDHKRKMISRRL